MKGFRVVSCPWRTPDVAVKQVDDMLRFRDQSTDQMRDRYYGVMQTVWSGAGDFMDAYYEERLDEERGDSTQWNTFKTMYDRINQLNTE